MAFAAINNQSYTDLTTLVDRDFLDSRFTNGFNGYDYAAVDTMAGTTAELTTPDGFGITAAPKSESTGRFTYGIAPDQVVRYLDTNADPMICGSGDCTAGDPIGTTGAGS